MNRSLALFIITCLGLVSFAIAAEKKAPEKITFETKNGKVIFLHSKHTDREKNKCDVCHTKLFQKDSKAPLNYKLKLHKDAEGKKISCAVCHVNGGRAFASKGNCLKCHEKKKS